jgi:hypothetical protein
MKKIRINYWEVKGYRGHSDYDGPEDNNFNTVVAVDARFTKDDVLDMIIKKLSEKHRVVVLSAKLVKTVEETERIHAHWILDWTSKTDGVHQNYLCSNCMYTGTWVEGQQGKYCPGCGAIMDEEPDKMQLELFPSS